MPWDGNSLELFCRSYAEITQVGHSNTLFYTVMLPNADLVEKK